MAAGWTRRGLDIDPAAGSPSIERTGRAERLGRAFDDPDGWLRQRGEFHEHFHGRRPEVVTALQDRLAQAVRLVHVALAGAGQRGMGS